MTQATTQRSIVLSHADFITEISTGDVLLGLDVGSTRVGVAVSNGRQTIANPRPSLVRNGWENDKLFLDTFILEQSVKGIILGNPLTLKGAHGRAVDAVLSFADLLKKAHPNLPITLWDERLTTVAAEKEIFTARQGRQKRMSKKDSKNYVDSAAAVLILQGFLDFLHPTLYEKPKVI